MMTVSYLDPRRASYLVLSAMVVTVVCWVIAGLMDEDWALFEKTLCHLGTSDILFVRILYPISCAVIGFGLMLFGYSVAKVCDRRLQAAGYYSCILFGISMLGIGFVNMDYSFNLHMTFVYAMGVTAVMVLMPITVDDLKHGKWALFAFVLFIAAGFIFFTIVNTDYQQPFTIACMFIWLIIKSVGIIRTGSAY